MAGDIGDISNFLKEGGLANLDWLDVDEKAQRELDRLPKQNLDVVPELEAQWSHEDKGALAYFVPNQDRVHTMADMSELHGPIRDSEPEVLKTARLSLIESSDVRKWQATLTRKFAREDLASCRTALAGVLAERGLLGGLYIDSKDFPTCATTKEAAQFVKKYASGAPFVLSKSACGDCTQNQSGRCGVFHKQLVSEVPYSETLADKVERDQTARGFQASTKAGASPKERIQAVLLNKTAGSTQFTGQANSGAVIPTERLLRKKEATLAEREESLRKAKAEPMMAMIRRELLKGRTAEEVTHGLRLAFDVRDLKSTQSYWLPVLKEAGLYGSVYSTQESFPDCREGAEFLSKHSSKVRAIVAGDKCSGCIFSKVGRCMMYGRKLVASKEDVYTEETVAAVLDEHKMAGTIQPYLINQKWGSDPREALKNIHKTATSSHPVHRIQQPRMDIATAFHGSSPSKQSSDLTKRDIVKTASRYLNEGLYGSELETVLRSKYDPRDILAAAKELKPVLAEQGLQGIYYVDPTVYDDYGQGCHTAQRMHRSRQAVRYAKVGDKCASCVHQTMPGKCSVLNKHLVHEPPYVDKAAQQREILASGKATTVDYDSLVNNGLTMMQEFELTGGSGNIDLNPSSAPLVESIEFGSNEVDVSKL